MYWCFIIFEQLEVVKIAIGGPGIEDTFAKHRLVSGSRSDQFQSGTIDNC